MDANFILALEVAAGVGLTNIVTAVRGDWDTFKAFQSFKEFIAYDWGKVTWRGFRGFLIGFIPSIGIYVLQHLPQATG